MWRGSPLCGGERAGVGRCRRERGARRAPRAPNNEVPAGAVRIVLPLASSRQAEDGYPPRVRRRGDHPAPIARRGLARDAGPGQGSDSDVSRTGSAFSPARAPALPAPVGRRGRMMGAAHPRGVRQIVPPPQHERSAPSPASATADIPPRRLEAAAPEAPGKTRRSAPRSLVSQVAPRCGPPPRGAETVTWARPPRDRSAGSAGHSRGTAPPPPAHRGITPRRAAST